MQRGDCRRKLSLETRKGRVFWRKNFRDNKSWFFTTFGVVAYLASFEKLNAVIREEEVAFGLLRQPNKKVDCFILLPPCEVTW